MNKSYLQKCNFVNEKRFKQKINIYYAKILHKPECDSENY